MHRGFSFALIVLSLFTVPFQRTQAGGAPWSVWLFSPEKGYLVRVAIDGTWEEGNFYPPEGHILSSVNFTADGNRMAACIFPIPTGENVSPEKTLLAIHDFSTNSTLTTLELDGPISCAAGYAAFDESGDLFAFNQMRPSADLPDWVLNVLDITSGEIIYSLDATAEGLPEKAGVPVVAQVHRDEVLFLSTPYVEIAANAGLYAWYPGNMVQERIVYPTSSVDRLSSGDAVWLANDLAYPVPEAGSNVVQFLPGTAEGGASVIFNDPNLALWDAFFIDSGRKILIAVQDLTTHEARLMYLDRSGASGTLASGIGQGLVPAPMGYLIYGNNSAREFEIQSVAFDKQGNLQPAETIWTDSTDTDWVVVWHEPLPLPDILEPFLTVNP